MTRRKIDAMREVYGRSEDICANCMHLRRVRPTERAYFKCAAYGDSNCEATDWRAGWMGCGLHNRPLPPLYVPLIEVLKHAPRKQQDAPINGQTKMEGL